MEFEYPFDESVAELILDACFEGLIVNNQRAYGIARPHQLVLCGVLGDWLEERGFAEAAEIARNGLPMAAILGTKFGGPFWEWMMKKDFVPRNIDNHDRDGDV